MVVAMRLFCGFLRIWLTAIVVIGSYVLMLVVMMPEVLRSLAFLVVRAIDAHRRPCHLDRQERYQQYERKAFHHFQDCTISSKLTCPVQQQMNCPLFAMICRSDGSRRPLTRIL